MPASLPPYQRASFPGFPGWRAALGPAIVWMALAQGSGELIWWPYLVAKYGLGFVCLLIPACLLQYPFNVEIGRYTVMTGESLYQGFIRVSRGYAVLVWILMTLSFLWFGAFASAGGTALADLTKFPADWTPRGRTLFWGYATIAVYLVALLFSRVVYVVIERFMWGIAIVSLVGLTIACTHPDVVAAIPSFARALWLPPLALPRPWDPDDAERFLTAITFAGLGGFWCTFYSYWLREKGSGMAGRMGHITGVLGREERIPQCGWLPDGDAATVREGRRWLRFLRWDSIVGIAGNILTTLMTCLLAWALLFPRGLLPQGTDLAVVQAAFFETSWGVAGRMLFLVVAAAFLTDGWMATVDSVARVQTDLTYNLVPGADRRGVRWWYFAYLIVFTAITCGTMVLDQPGALLVLSAVIGFVGTLVYSLGLYVLNFRLLKPQLPLELRPGRVPEALFLFSTFMYFVLAAVFLWTKLS